MGGAVGKRSSWVHRLCRQLILYRPMLDTKEPGILDRVPQSLCSSSRKWAGESQDGCGDEMTGWLTMLCMLAVIIISILETREPRHGDCKWLVKKSRTSKRHLIRVQLLSYTVCLLPSDLSQFCDSCRSQLLPCGAKPTVTLRCLVLLPLRISALSKELAERALSSLTLICWTNAGLCCLLS